METVSECELNCLELRLLELENKLNSERYSAIYDIYLVPYSTGSPVGPRGKLYVCEGANLVLNNGNIIVDKKVYLREYKIESFPIQDFVYSVSNNRTTIEFSGVVLEDDDYYLDRDGIKIYGSSTGNAKIIIC